MARFLFKFPKLVVDGSKTLTIFGGQFFEYLQENLIWETQKLRLKVIFILKLQFKKDLWRLSRGDYSSGQHRS